MGANTIRKNNAALIAQFVRDEELAHDDIFDIKDVRSVDGGLSFVVRYDAYSEETLFIDSLDLMGYVAAKAGIIRTNKEGQ